MSDTTTETQTATQEQVPAIRSDSVVAYLSGMAGALSAIVNDLNTQVAQITDAMNKEKKND